MEEKTCENCNFYEPHYLIWRGQLISASCGQCGNHALWEPKRPPLETHKPTVEMLLRETRERLSIIAALLKENT